MEIGQSPSTCLTIFRCGLVLSEDMVFELMRIMAAVVPQCNIVVGPKGIQVTTYASVARTTLEAVCQLVSSEYSAAEMQRSSDCLNISTSLSIESLVSRFGRMSGVR